VYNVISLVIFLWHQIPFMAQQGSALHVTVQASFQEKAIFEKSVARESLPGKGLKVIVFPLLLPECCKVTIE